MAVGAGGVPPAGPHAVCGASQRSDDAHSVRTESPPSGDAAQQQQQSLVSPWDAALHQSPHCGSRCKPNLATGCAPQCTCCNVHPRLCATQLATCRSVWSRSRFQAGCWLTAVAAMAGRSRAGRRWEPSWHGDPGDRGRYGNRAAALCPVISRGRSPEPAAAAAAAQRCGRVICVGVPGRHPGAEHSAARHPQCWSPPRQGWRCRKTTPYSRCVPSMSLRTCYCKTVLRSMLVRPLCWRLCVCVFDVRR